MRRLVPKNVKIFRRSSRTDSPKSGTASSLLRSLPACPAMAFVRRQRLLRLLIRLTSLAPKAVSSDATPDFHLRYTDKNEIVLSSYYEKTRPSQHVAA